MTVSKDKQIRVIFYAYSETNNYNAQNLSAKEFAKRLSRSIFYSSIFLSDRKKQDTSLEQINLIEINFANPLLKHLKELYHLIFDKNDFVVCDHVNITIITYLLLKRFILWNPPIFIHTIANVYPSPYSGKFYDWMAKFIARHSDIVLGNSKYVCQKARPWCGRKVLYKNLRGIDPETFYPSRKKSDMQKRFTVICCGSLQLRKNPDIFLDMAKLFPSYKFIWIGEGMLKQRIEKRISEERIQNIDLINNVHHKYLSEYFRNSDVFLFPSRTEGFPSVLLQAQACGLPAIAFNDYRPEVITDGKNGFIINRFSEIQPVIELLSTNSKLLNELKQNAINNAKQYHWDRIAHNYESFLIAIHKRIKKRL